MSHSLQHRGHSYGHIAAVEGWQVSSCSLTVSNAFPLLIPLFPLPLGPVLQVQAVAQAQTEAVPAGKASCRHVILLLRRFRKPATRQSLAQGCSTHA